MPMPFERVGVAVVTLLVFSLFVFVAVSGVLIHSRSVRSFGKYTFKGMELASYTNVTGAFSHHGRRSVARFVSSESSSRNVQSRWRSQDGTDKDRWCFRTTPTKYSYSSRCLDSLLLDGRLYLQRSSYY